MGRKTNPSTDAARDAWMAAPKKGKPSAQQLMERFGIARATAYRGITAWTKEERRLARVAKKERPHAP